MNKFSSLLAFLLLVNGGLWAKPANTVQLLGQWAGVLPVLGGSRQVRIHISP